MPLGEELENLWNYPLLSYNLGWTGATQAAVVF